MKKLGFVFVMLSACVMTMGCGEGEVANPVDDVKDAVEDAGSDMKDAAGDAVEGAKDAAGTAIDGAADAAKDAIGE